MKGERVVSEQADSLPSLRLIKASVEIDVVYNSIFWLEANAQQPAGLHSS